MTNLGLGVMLQMLGGNKESVKAFKKAVGEEIAKVKIVERGNSPENCLEFTFANGYRMAIIDDGQSCCERRWMHTDDNLDDFIGAILLDADVREGGEESVDEWSERKESEFLIIKTSLGEFTIVNYNEHNGYYGGFWIVAKEL